jgi:hypothetical protein
MKTRAAVAFEAKKPLEIVERHVQEAGQREATKLRKFLRVLALIEKRLGEKCQILEYQITTYENESVVQAIHDALSKCRLQEGPLAYERQDGVTRMHISFCDTPTRHREFLEQLRKMSDVTDVRVL